MGEESSIERNDDEQATTPTRLPQRRDGHPHNPGVAGGAAAGRACRGLAAAEYRGYGAVPLLFLVLAPLRCASTKKRGAPFAPANPLPGLTGLLPPPALVRKQSDQRQTNRNRKSRQPNEREAYRNRTSREHGEQLPDLNVTGQPDAARGGRPGRPQRPGRVDTGHRAPPANDHRLQPEYRLQPGNQVGAVAGEYPGGCVSRPGGGYSGLPRPLPGVPGPLRR